jgi:hypothetical protein
MEMMEVREDEDGCTSHHVCRSVKLICSSVSTSNVIAWRLYHQPFAFESCDWRTGSKKGDSGSPLRYNSFKANPRTRLTPTDKLVPHQR